MTARPDSTRIGRLIGGLNGPQTLGRGPLFWSGFVACVVLFALSPLVLGRFQVINLSNFMIFSLLALSLCLIWGYAGILSLGQACFMGIGGYAFGIAAINLIGAHGNTGVAVLVGIAVPMAFAALLGAAMFYARLEGVYVAILTLVISRLLETFLLQTADTAYRIGDAALGGSNGLRSLAAGDGSLPNLIIGAGSWAIEFDGRGYGFFYLTLAVLVVVYLGLRWLVNSSAGYLLLAVREDPQRTETFGYDVRPVQLAVFCLSAGIAGLAGVLYTAWGTYIHPSAFGIATNILPVIWVGVAGRKDLTAALVGALILQWLSLQLAAQGDYAPVVMGAILVVAMMIAPEGLLTQTLARLGARRRARGPDPAPAALGKAERA
ncbi:MAG: branched-chain amino acid ABC transporter permease [Burkholderiaceae bacterium]